ncbi:MAG: hypothetical protein LBK98_10045, partial [Peptococcaceae bacterium]|nr:hypothetical protein [Peptococcaceae bacterium]
RKRLTALLLTALLSLPASLPLRAAADGAYTVTTNTYYLNPDTGVTDDGGSGNAAIGEGMCRSVIYKTALAELDGGKTYLTVRLLLLSNMKDIRLSVQERPGGGYKRVTPRIMAEDAGTDSADYRFEVPSLTGYLSWEMYVIPMGRDVKFYMNVSDALAEGGGDFIVSVKPKTAEPPAPRVDEAPAATGTPPPAAAAPTAETPAGTLSDAGATTTPAPVTPTPGDMATPPTTAPPEATTPAAEAAAPGETAPATATAPASGAAATPATAAPVPDDTATSPTAAPIMEASANPATAAPAPDEMPVPATPPAAVAPLATASPADAEPAAGPAPTTPVTPAPAAPPTGQPGNLVYIALAALVALGITAALVVAKARRKNKPS